MCFAEAFSFCRISKAGRSPRLRAHRQHRMCQSNLTWFLIRKRTVVHSPAMSAAKKRSNRNSAWARFSHSARPPVGNARHSTPLVDSVFFPLLALFQFPAICPRNGDPLRSFAACFTHHLWSGC